MVRIFLWHLLMLPLGPFDGLFSRSPANFAEPSLPVLHSKVFAKELVGPLMKNAMKQPRVKAMMAKIKVKVDHSNEQQVFKSSYNGFVTLAAIFIKAYTDEKLSITQMSSIWGNLPPAIKTDLVQRIDAVR